MRAPFPERAFLISEASSNFLMFGQFASTAQFYLYGKSNCTSTGWEKHILNYGKAVDDIVLPINYGVDSRDLSGRVFMVTGANAGIGKEVSSYLALKGGKVFLVCRNMERAIKAKSDILQIGINVGIKISEDNIVILVGDCGLEEDVRRVWMEFEQLSSRLDCLICNAGALSFEKTVTSEGVEVTFATHLLFGTYLLGSLAMDTLARTPHSRLVVVSSGGMYNTKFPSWLDATNTGISNYDGQLAYAYAKRGQVLLCERWAQLYSDRVKVVSCHPGWTATPGVDAAYGSAQSYLQPLRSLWQGAEGIIWLAVTDNVDQLEGGAFYLDRSPCVKHMAGPFFTEGSFTKNSQREVDEMMEKLQVWSSAATRPSPQEQDVERAKLVPLVASTSITLDLETFMGSWYVLANIPTFFEQNVGNCTESYLWNAEKKRIDITFTYRTKGSSQLSSASMKAVVMNSPLNTHWMVSPKLLGSIFMPIKLDYLIIDFDSVYLPDTGLPSMEYVTVGVPNRNYLWIMIRATPSEFFLDGKVAMEVLKTTVDGTEDKATVNNQVVLERAVLLKAINRATELGYDPALILRVPWSSA